MDRPLCIGIVGSRRRSTLTDRKIVIRLVAWLYGQNRGRSGISWVSGGAEGPDSFAKEACLKLFEAPLDFHEFPIDRRGLPWDTDRSLAYQMFTERAYSRNRLIAERADELYCLVHPDRKGGTENTISHARDLKKAIFLVEPDGSVYLFPDGETKRCEPVVRLLDLRSTD
jgi:predicted Rossmann fold nucleotide-binding protein DprA/Smf involved in DNA uptake